MQPCEVLGQIQSDLSKLIRPSTVPFKNSYTIGPGMDLEIGIKQLEDSGEYELTVSSSFGVEQVAHANFKKISELLVGLTWQAVVFYLVNRQMEPCPSMDHCGADEILLLYKSVKTFREDHQIPFTYEATGPMGSYNILVVKEKDDHFEIEIETNYIYGKSVKYIAEVEFENQIWARANKQLENVFAEWIRPESVKSMSVSLEQLTQSRGGRQSANTAS